MSERDERRERVAEVLLQEMFPGVEPLSAGSAGVVRDGYLQMANAVLAASSPSDEDRDAEIERLRTRVAELASESHRADLNFARAERAEADLATERARVARVEALQPAAARSGDGLSISVILPADLRRALSPDAEGGGE